ncbi:hypothetical protein IEO21_05088 [Rhodonia placenta]|uniref:Calcofluor white hypersensitive protein n=1 Tax=Rhodonia placenta TaxID=104341 RepID=A0A8H7P2J0_9APHY|nr:hypothetical protein IEO21_05088 [Postia placenta]
MSVPSRGQMARPSQLAFPAWYIARAHTILAVSAFATAFLMGCALHYKRIVKNGIAGWPDEWIPSVSATIGDWYPERNIFQILIALNSGPRLAIVLLQYYLYRSSSSGLPGFVMLCGILRTLSCGGWVYITSTDDHDAHDILMISYIVLNIPWMWGTMARRARDPLARRIRFWGSLIPMGYFFYQHKAKRIPGAFIYWSILTSLTPSLFYFSVWALEIAGQELSLLSTVSPILLGISPFSEWCRTRSGRTILHVLSLTGLAAYVLSSPLQRLCVVAFAVAAANIGIAVDWTSGEASYDGIMFCLGFLLSSIAKHANHSNVPVWPIVNEQSGGYNKTGIVLACLAIYNYATREPIPAVMQTERQKKQDTHSTEGTWLGGALSLGSLIFTLHCLLADPATLIAWSWTGYPVQGPVPHLHGSLTHIAQAIGLCLPLLLDYFGLDASDVLLHPLWLAYGGASAYYMCAYKNWRGYAGGLNFAVFLMSVTPLILRKATATSKIARTLFVAWFVVSVFVVVNVFTVAYAFVPGGEYFRERMHLVLLTQMMALALAFRWPRRRPEAPLASSMYSSRFAFLSAAAVLSILSLLVTMYRWPTVVVKPYRQDARIVRAGIWTVHFGIDNEGRDSQRRMRDLIKDMELDVVGLLETDLHRTVFGNRDLTRVMVEELGYYADIGPGPNSHTWGAILLSKFPILNSTHHLLPSPHGELAPAIEAVLDMYGTEVTVVVSHNGQEETPLDRELQATELARIMSNSYPNPVIFLGYVVTKPLASRPAPYEIMVTDGRVHDIDEQDWDRWCEYIFYRGLYRTSYARVSRSTITDTELQIGQFVVPKNGAGVQDDSDNARYLRAWKEEIPEVHWFPKEYYPEVGGKRGHSYHVFNTPLYYKIPEGVAL